MFRGQFSHSIDQKGRVSLPARFREVLEASGDLRIIAVPWPFDRCLRLHPLGTWRELENKVAGMSPVDPSANHFRRKVLSPATDLELDGSGRVRIASELRQHAGIETEALWLGMGTFIEIWSPPRYEEATRMTDEQFNEFRNRVEELFRI